MPRADEVPGPEGLLASCGLAAVTYGVVVGLSPSAVRALGPLPSKSWWGWDSDVGGPVQERVLGLAASLVIAAVAARLVEVVVRRREQGARGLRALGAGVAGTLAAGGALALVELAFWQPTLQSRGGGTAGWLALLGLALAFGVVAGGRTYGLSTARLSGLVAPCSVLGLFGPSLATGAVPLGEADLYRLGVQGSVVLAALLVLPLALVADAVEKAWRRRRLPVASPPEPAADSPHNDLSHDDVSHDDHLAAARAIGRTLLGGGLRVGLGLGTFGLLCAVPPAIVEAATFYADTSWGVRTYREAIGTELALAAILALSLGALRAIELAGNFLRPDLGYVRKLAMGVLVAGLSLAAVYALLLQVRYVAGLIQGGGTVAAGLGGIAGTEDLLGKRGGDLFGGIALAFGITGFGRARGLPLREQVGLVGVFGLFFVSSALVYEGTLAVRWGDSHSYELLIQLTAWACALALPGLARTGDRLEERCTPRVLAHRPAADVEALATAARPTDDPRPRSPSAP